MGNSIYCSVPAEKLMAAAAWKYVWVNGIIVKIRSADINAYYLASAPWKIGLEESADLNQLGLCIGQWYGIGLRRHPL